MRIKSTSANLGLTKSGKEYIKLTFPFDRNIINFVKTFPNYSYNPKKGFWRIDLNAKNIKTLQANNFIIQEPLKDWEKLNNQKLMNINAPLHIKGLKLTPYPYQNSGINFIEYRKGKALIADEPGLGKTIQALGWLQLHPELRPALIVSPSTLKFNWAIESHKWMTRPKIQILSGQTPYPITGELLIINPDLLQHWVDCLVEVKVKVIIVDEIHYFKDSGTIRYQKLKEISKFCKNRIGLSGTPIINKPIEIYYIWQWIDSSSLPHWPYFTRTFCDPKNNGFGMDYSGATNLSELNDLLTQSIMIRRTKKEVLPELPEKFYTVIPLDIDNRKEYDQAFRNFTKYHMDEVLAELGQLKESTMKFIKKSTKNKDILQLDLFDTEEMEGDLIETTLTKLENSEALMKLSALRQLAARGKVKEFLRWLKNFLMSGEKIVIFCEHREIMKEVVDGFEKKTVYINGSVKGTKRQQAITEFQNNPKIQIFIGNKAAQEGVTLTSASTVAHIEYPWNSTSIDQRNDRCNRIGAKFNTNVLYFVAHKTIEEQLIEIIDVKREITDQAIDNKSVDEAHVLKKLLNQIKTKSK